MNPSLLPPAPALFWGSLTPPPPTARYRAVHRPGVVLEAFCYGLHPAPAWVRAPGVLVPIAGPSASATLRTRFGSVRLSGRDWVVLEDGQLTLVPDEMFQVLFTPEWTGPWSPRSLVQRMGPTEAEATNG